jgi:hypothetical protein
LRLAKLLGLTQRSQTAQLQPAVFLGHAHDY